MTRKTLWLVVSGLMALSLVMAACGPAAVEEEEEEKQVVVVEEEEEEEVVAEEEEEVVSPDTPQYGGTLTAARTGDITGWDIYGGPFYGGRATALTSQSLWAGDWAKGPAGGYGTNEIDWANNGYDAWNLKAGYVAESWEWSIDAAKDEGTVVWQIRQGIHFALNQDSEASRMVGGRELTADDVAFTLSTVVSDSKSMIYSRVPELRVAEITQSGPWEVTVKVPAVSTAAAITRLGDLVRIIPREVLETYGNMNDWKRNVGSGPFMIDAYIPGSVITYVKNPTFWGKDPVGPGQGNQLPYIDRYRELIIPDASTRQAALRTGKIDRMDASWEDAPLLTSTAPALVEMEMPGTESFAIKPRVDRAPFDDVRVRRAMMMAIDFESINDALNDGRGQILNYPIAFYTAYADVYLSLDDPEMPDSVKELYVYNPTKAKELLTEAGYPDGFKTKALMTSTEVDIYSIYKDMWSKVGIDLELDVRESGAKSAIIRSGDAEDMTRNGATPISAWLGGADWTPGSRTNPGHVDDPIIADAIAEINANFIMDQAESKRLYRELLKYVLDQAYAIPVTDVPSSRLWWPWLKNYSGESSVGYLDHPNWIQWVWIDQELKKEMGY